MSKTTPPTRGRLLVVDDEPRLCYQYQRLLEHEGYQVHTAEGGEAALRAWAAQDFDLLLLDLRMPDLDGMEVLRRVRQDGRRLDIVILSGWATLAEALEAGRWGVAQVLTKPYDLAEFLATVQRLVSRREPAVVAYLRTHFAEITSRGAVARRFACTGQTISAQVQRATGQSFRDFLYECRLREAQRRLVETELEVKEIAAQVGFRSYNTFWRAFRRQIGWSPEHFRSYGRTGR